MGKKIVEKAVKIYKPEILICPKCKSSIKYNYTVSNKVVQFTSGKYFRIKNLGYSCPSCNDGKIYFSQTANKLCFKGYTYSAKVICLIDYYKNKRMSREEICDILISKGIEISDRNVDILHKKFLSFYELDYDNTIKEAYNKMASEYGEIRISLDLITINEKNYVILYDFFKGNILAVWKVNGITDPNLKKLLELYIGPQNNISLIATVRNISKFVPLVKSVTSNKTKFITFNKF